MKLTPDQEERAKDATSPDPITADVLSNTYPYTESKRKAKRATFTLTPAQYCDLKEVHNNLGPAEINLHLWWANLGDELGFKWWTMRAIADKPLFFTAEIL